MELLIGSSLQSFFSSFLCNDMDKGNEDICEVSQEDMDAVGEGQFEVSGERQNDIECGDNDEQDEHEQQNEDGEVQDEDDEVQDEDDGLEKTEILDEFVRDVAGGQTNVEVEPTLSDMSEMKLVQEFVKKGCGCKLLKGEQCCQQFTTEYILEVRSHAYL